MDIRYFMSSKIEPVTSERCKCKKCVRSIFGLVPGYILLQKYGIVDRVKRERFLVEAAEKSEKNHFNVFKLL